MRRHTRQNGYYRCVQHACMCNQYQFALSPLPPQKNPLVFPSIARNNKNVDSPDFWFKIGTAALSRNPGIKTPRSVKFFLVG